jgi:spermidine synthase
MLSWWQVPNRSLLILNVFTFLGAFLLFSLEPLTGRLLLPGYGGSFHVWTTCLMLFQGLLVLGYVYCHGLAPKIGRLHFIFAALPLISLPIDVVGFADVHSPILSLSKTLLLSVGLPFLVLASTSVMAQYWLSNSDLKERSNPYQLYAASNLGSLLALLVYPIFIEPFMTLSSQKLAWSFGYVTYLILTYFAWRVAKKRVPAKSIEIDTTETSKAPNEEVQAGEEAKDEAPTLAAMLYWFALAALPSALLMGVTNVLTIDVGSLPLLWVLPLALYTLTFVLIFRPGNTEEGNLALRLLPETVLAGIALNYGTTVRIGYEVPNHLLILFALCYAGHSELYRTRPGPKYLTRFYLIMSLGGWAGGLFVCLVAPKIFTHLYEYPVAMLALAVILFCGRISDFKVAVKQQSNMRYFLSSIICLAFAYMAIGNLVEDKPSSVKWIYTHRNFYGIHRIKEASGYVDENDTVRTFMHGTTIHGYQLMVKDGGKLPLSYYHPKSPLGGFLNAREARPYKMAVIGLGSGTLSAYCRKGDELTFYELDPDNERIARKYFDFLKMADGKVNVIAGDARLSLKNVPKPVFDLIIVDAFSSDAIPVHLLTREAMALYLTKLKPGGRVIFHISNRYYDLEPVVATTAATLDLKTMVGHRNFKDQKRGNYEMPSSWVVLVPRNEDSKKLRALGFYKAKTKGQTISPWTDEYASIIIPLWFRYFPP